MSELVIKYHDFENAKKELKKFSEQTTTDLDLKRIDDSKGVGEWFGDFILGSGIGWKHKVTGEELNELTTQIQSHLHSVNNTQIKLIKEFGQVYSALEALDKDYIQAILVSIKATEETSQSIQETQGQIKKIVENQIKTIEELKKFKQKLDGYAHLADIDKIWSDCQKWYKEINTLSNSISSAAASSKESAQKADVVKIALKAAEKAIDDLSKQLEQQIAKLESIISFTDALEKITHLQDVDEMWESISSAHDSLQNIGDELTLFKNTAVKQQADIETFLAFMETLSDLAHLTDIDVIWNRTEEHQLRIGELAKRSETHTIRLEEQKQRDEVIIDLLEANKTSIHGLNEYKTKLCSMAHLDDVDDIWESVENHSTQLSELEKQSDEIKDIVKTNKDHTNAAIAGAIEQSNIAVEMLTKKIKYAYLFAGGAVGLAIIELIVILMKVI